MNPAIEPADSPGEFRSHGLTPREFEAAATGSGPFGPAELWRAERSRRLLLLDLLLDARSDAESTPGPLPPLDEAWDLLVAAQRRDGAEVDRLVLLPETGLWLASVLRRLHEPAVERAGDPPLWVAVGHLHALAASAAAAAGLDFALRVPTRGGDAWLPALGRASLPGLAVWDSAEVVRHAGRLAVRAGAGEVRVPSRPELPVPGWRPARRLRFGPRDGAGTVLLDDLGFHRVLPVDPAHADSCLDADTAERWSTLLDDAWPVLCAADAQCASDVRDLLRTLEPVPVGSPFLTESATSGDGVGAVATADPGNAVELAATLTHESQHSKLGMLMHLYRLLDRETDNRFYAPWRHDPRSLRGMLQGIYAFMGVARFWRGHRLHGLCDEHDPHAGLAAFEFALWRRQLAVALAGVHGRPELGALGLRFVALLGGVVDGWQQEPLPEAAQAAADRVAADHHVRWRLHHLAPHPELVAALADDRSRAGEDALFAGRGPALCPDPRVPSLNVWWSLTRSSQGARAGPGPDKESSGAPPSAAARLAEGRSRIPDVRAADLVLLRGDVDRAVALYTAEIVRARADGRPPAATAGAWAGLRLALAAGPGSGDAARALWCQPELVAGVYRAVLDRGGLAPDPVEFAATLGAGPAGLAPAGPPIGPAPVPGWPAPDPGAGPPDD